MTNLLSLLRHYMWKLNEPQLVADFQSFCGIEITCRDSGLSSAAEDTSTDSGGQGISDVSGVSKATCLHVNDTGVEKRPTVVKPVDQDSANTSSDDSEEVRGTSTDASREKKKNNGEVWGEQVKSDITRFNIQKYSMDNNVYFKVNNKLLYYLGHLGAHLGNESFLCYFFPYWFWNVDGYVCRRVILVWAFIMYVGQSAKDAFKMPRPTSPPVAKLEKRYELEYGMPSTHAMVGFAIPYSLLKFTIDRYEYSYSLAVAACLAWTLLVCFSRLYLGMHSVLDVIVGLTASIIYTPIIHYFLDAIDHFQLTHDYAPIIVTTVAFIASLCYPQLEKWSTARGDTVIILGICGGVATASWLAFRHGLYTQPAEPPPYTIKWPPDTEFLITTAIRMALGGTIMMATRSGLKAVVYRLCCAVFSLNPADRKSNTQLLRVELPCKFGVYFFVSFAVVYIAPWVFRCVGVERVTFFTDL